MVAILLGNNSGNSSDNSNSGDSHEAAKIVGGIGGTGGVITVIASVLGLLYKYWPRRKTGNVITSFANYSQFLACHVDPEKEPLIPKGQ